MTSLFRLIIHKLVNPSRSSVATGLDRIREVVADTDTLLSSSDRYLPGDRFTAADLSLACMMAPLVLPDNYGIRLPQIEELPCEAQPVVREFRNTVTDEYVLRLFDGEKPSVTPGKGSS